MHLAKVILNTREERAGAGYPFNIPVLRETHHIDFSTPVTFFVGDNGTGKSTLLRAMTRKCGIFIWGERKEMSRNEKRLLEALSIEWKDGPVPGSLFSSELFFNFSRIADDDEASWSSCRFCRTCPKRATRSSSSRRIPPSCSRACTTSITFP
jgi:predicted ATPase